MACSIHANMCDNATQHVSSSHVLKVVAKFIMKSHLKEATLV